MGAFYPTRRKSISLKGEFWGFWGRETLLGPKNALSWGNVAALIFPENPRIFAPQRRGARGYPNPRLY